MPFPFNRTYRHVMLLGGLTLCLSLACGGGGGETGAENTTPPPGPVLPSLPEENPNTNHVGMNTWFLNTWDRSFAFADAMKHSRPWMKVDFSGPTSDVDALDWPTTDAATLFTEGTPADQVNGTYKLVFNGQADVDPIGGAGSVSNKIYKSDTNTTTADVTFSVANPTNNNCGLRFRNTKRLNTSATNSGVTNVRLYRPGYPADGSIIFTTPFLNGLRKVNVVRMMDWTATNTNLVIRWTDRVTPLHSTQGGLKALAYTGPNGWKPADPNRNTLGVAIEHQIQLCNVLKADCWINVPTVADADFVLKLAQALRYGTDGTNPYTGPTDDPVYPPLDPNLRVYVEYSNEIWNGGRGFHSFHAIKDIVEAFLAANPSHELDTPTTKGNIYANMWRYPAYRIVSISETFRRVYGDASMMNRVRPVLMTQLGNGQNTIREALSWLDGYVKRKFPGREMGYFIYGAGGSGYYGVNAYPAQKDDLDGFFASGNYPDVRSTEAMGLDAVWSNNYGLKRVAYEGGMGLDGQYNDDEARTINADSRMKDVVIQTHNAWSSVGGDLLVYYMICGQPSWEFTPKITILDTPKYQGLDAIKNAPRSKVTLGQALPGTLIATDWPNYKIRDSYDYPETVDGVSYISGNDAGEWLALPAHADVPFNGSLVVNGRLKETTRLAVWVNGVRKGEVILEGGSTFQRKDSSSLSLAIPGGLVVIRLEVLSGGFSLHSISITNR